MRLHIDMVVEFNEDLIQSHELPSQTLMRQLLHFIRAGGHIPLGATIKPYKKGDK